jgi:hypothetical protein
MKSQVISENGDDTISGSGDVVLRHVASKALMSSGSSSDHKQAVALLKPVTAISPAHISLSNAIK